MALGDGIRRDVASISQAERDLLLDAFLKLDTTKFYPDGVSYWDKQEDIHKNAHFNGVDVHAGPAFIPWHRVLVNRLEELIREVHPELSLHYWDWTSDPRAASAGRAALFTPQFMGGTGNPAGPPFQDFESTEKTDPFGDGIHDHIWRQVGQVDAKPNGTPNLSPDATILAAPDFVTFNQGVQSAHNIAHGYIGGSIGDAHFSFHDPFVFLLHSNMDRLWAMWQAQAGHPERFNPATVYGTASIPVAELVQPWAGGTGLDPWASDPTVRAVINYYDPSVIAPPCYDTLPTQVILDEVTNPGSVIHFNDVPTGETAARAAVFRIYACGDVTLEVKAGAGPAAPYSVLTPGGSVLVKHQLEPYVDGRIWFGFTGQAANTVGPTGAATIRVVETGEEFPFTLTANSIARPTVAVLLTLDQSGSMDDPAGAVGAKRIDVLRQAASQFVELVPPNDGVGLVRFDTVAYPVNDPTYPGLPVTQMGPGGLFDPGRITVRAAVQSHQTNPNGSTSIGAGVQLARNTITPVTGYDDRALVVFTDGLENTLPTIASVQSAIDQRTFAIGLGDASQVSTAALNALTNGTGGYMLLTGQLGSGVDDFFRLTKYFLQILAGVTNTSVVLDPSGSIPPGHKLRIPFVLNEADIDTTVILLEDLPAVQLLVETPDGDVIDPAVAAGFGDVYADGTAMSYYRLNLPVPLGTGAHGGTWHALLEVDERSFRRALAKLEDKVALQRAQAHGVRFNVSVQSYSSIRLQARLDQDSLQPGATLRVRAALSEYGIPVDHRAAVRTELHRPDGTAATLPMAEVDPGVFEVVTVASSPGIYLTRVIAEGLSLRGLPFTREQTLTGATLRGGDGPDPFGGDDPSGTHTELCRLLECLLGKDELGRFLAERNIDPDAIRKCLDAFCRTRPTEPR
jgi:hypothetical protein